MKPKVTRVHVLIFFAGLFPPLAFFASIVVDKVDWPSDCASCLVGRTCEGGIVCQHIA